MEIKAPAQQQRYLLVDGLRGVAAFAVLCHHLFHNSALERPLWNIMPVLVCEFCHFGSFGVQIFFVLSGFVIPHSLRNLKLTPPEVGNFLVRRQLRLDPPYWTIVILTVLVTYLQLRMPWINKSEMPTLWVTLKNLVYLQNILGVQQVVPVSWTLCLEVQFYLVLILLLMAGKFRNATGSQVNAISVTLVTVLGFVSMCIPRHTMDAWFIQWWFYFAAGVLCYWAVQRPKLRPLFYVFLLAFLVDSIIQDPPPMLTGLGTVVLLYVAGITGNLAKWLNVRPIQYLGKISYSLYLSHLLFAGLFLRMGFRLTGTDPGFALMWFVMAIGISIVFAHGMFWAVEQRSMRFASSLKRVDAARRIDSINSNGADLNGSSLVPASSGERI